MVRTRSLPVKPPAVALGEAREALQRALLFGTPAEVDNAEAKIEEALARQADQDRVEHASLIEEILGRLPEPVQIEDPTIAMIDRAATGEILYSELADAWRSDPDSLGLSDRERTFAEADPRRLRALVLAHRAGISLEEVENAVARVEDSQQEEFALAARSDRAFNASSLSEWLTSYAAGLTPKGMKRR
ncbi:hypothetical protein ACFVKB_39130 [Rhodococcus sp. NPDC127530]|uniref:hypothetical protein n=1 Tax=unclassified Rhodococcus (in: high G+C Gram-positive bacteria) TaxID=192944 RepID=UPI003636F4BB